MKGGFGVATTAFFGTTVVDALARNASKTPLKLKLSAVLKNLDDSLAVPAGYSMQVLFLLAEHLHPSVPEYQNDGRIIADSFLQRAGDQHDGMTYLGLNGKGKCAPYASNRGLLCINQEATVPCSSVLTASLLWEPVSISAVPIKIKC